MPDYTLYGLQVRSSFRLHHVPEHPHNPLRAADIEFDVRFDDMSAPVSDAGWQRLRTLEGAGWTLQTDRSADASAPGMRLVATQAHRRSVVTFSAGATSVICTVSGDTTSDDAYWEDLSGWFTGALMAQALAVRGYVVLHASVVATPAGAVAFLGASGDGKSTLASRLVDSGHQLIADDHLVLAPDTEKPAALPGPPRLRLMPDVTKPDAGRTDRDGKAYVAMDAGRRSHPSAPIPLVHVFALAGYADPDAAPVIQTFDAGEALTTLSRNRFVHSEIYRGATSDGLRRLSHVAAAVPVSRLVRPRGLHRLRDVVDAIERTVGLRPTPQ